MRKIRLLSLLLAMVLSVTLVLTACDNGNVGEHDHVWNEGEVTTEATCYSEGVKTYTCTVEGCKQTKTEPVAMIEHSWDQGAITTEPKCNAVGETTFKCTNSGCTATKKEPISKTEHRWDDGVITKSSEFSSAGVRTYACLDCDTTREASIDAHADFVEQFYTDAANKTDWSYGIASNFDTVSGNLEFVNATVDNNVWKEAGVEIESGSVKINSSKAAIVYDFSEDLPKLVKAKFNLSFKGGVVKAYLVVSGEQTTVITLNNDKAEWTYESDDGLVVAKGDKVYLILDSAATVEGALSFTIYAQCLHVWDQGTITTEPKCNLEGVKTFKCVSCEEEYTQTIDKLSHEWNDGEVTTEPTKDNEGVKTFTCKNCDATRTESIPKLEAANVIADFGDDFTSTLQGQSNWKVGTVDYVWDSETFNFTDLNAETEAFKCSEPWIEIKGDWMAANAMVGLAYTFQEAANVNFNFKLNTAGNFSVRWALKDKDGNIKTNSGRASWGGVGKEVTVTSDLTIEAGDTLYILINKEGDSSTDQCTFSLEITGEEISKFEGANFGNNFTSTLQGQTNWKVGTIDYVWASETFNFNVLTADTEAFKCSEPWAEIKGDWMAIDAMVGLAYTFQEAANVNFNFKLNTEGNFSVRWALKDKVGNIKTNNGQASWGGVGKEVTVTDNLTVAVGDTLYILVNKEGDSSTNQCTFSLTISSNGQSQPTGTFEGANFGNDFTSTLQGQTNWKVGTIDYVWASETFNFNVLTADTEAFKCNDPWAEIKGDWMAIDAMVGLAYTFKEQASVNFNFKLNTEGNFSVRWALKDKDGNIKTNNGQASWGGVGKEVTVTSDLTIEAGDTLYILINKEGDSSTNQCTFSLNIAQKQ